MASPSSSISSDPGAYITVSQHEFNLFHNIDRELFSRILIDLCHEPGEAIQVMAFFMWLEKITKDFRMISNLLKWPIPLLDGLVNEVISTLNCIESNQLSYTNYFNLPFIQSIARSHITLQYFYDNRVNIIRAITKLINDVCVRAFTDIVQKVQYERLMKQQSFTFGSFHGPMSNPYMKQAMYYNGAPLALAPVAPHFNEGSSNAWRGYGYEPYDIENHKEDLNNELTEVLGALDLNDGNGSSSGDKKEVPIDERTIFLTFSKGYPISEFEVRDFFSRRYGHIIEAVYMQDVPATGEQPLYARLVLLSSASNMINEIILEGINGRAKFTINGKHVWARKYIRKSTKSPPASPSATSTSH